jgi:hypothetical protein
MVAAYEKEATMKRAGLMMLAALVTVAWTGIVFTAEAVPATVQVAAKTHDSMHKKPHKSQHKRTHKTPKKTQQK